MKDSHMAKLMVFIEVFLLVFTFFCYFWLKNILVGIYFVAIIICALSTILGLILSIIYLFKVYNVRLIEKTKKSLYKIKNKLSREKLDKKTRIIKN